MFHELARADYPRVRPLFTSLPLSLAIDAVIAGNTPARLWADDAARPTTALMWDTGRCYYLAGDPTHPHFNSAVRRWVADQIVRGPLYAKVLYGSADWETAIPPIFTGVSIARAERVVCALEHRKVPDRAAQPPDGFRMAPLDEPLLRTSQLANPPSSRRRSPPAGVPWPHSWPTASGSASSARTNPEMPRRLSAGAPRSSSVARSWASASRRCRPIAATASPPSPPPRLSSTAAPGA
jgi:hypothetical protein